MSNALAAETSPYLRQHADNPVDWLPWGPVALARAREEDRPLLVSIGYSACHWCHVMERESFEDERTAALMNEELRLREGRPRGAPRRRRAVHGGRAGDDRPRRLAAERVPHARAAAVLRRHLLPARAAPRACPRGRRCCRRSPRRGASAARRSAPAASGCASGCRAARWLTPSPEPLDEQALDAGAWRGCAASYRRRATAASARRAEVPAGVGARVPAGAAPAARPRSAAEREMALQTLRAMAARRHLRPARRRLRPLRRRRHLDGAALREDALRQRAARPRLPARLAGSRRRAPAGGLPRDARLGAARDARPRGRLLLPRSTPTPRASRAGSTCGRVAELRDALGEDADAAIAWFGATEQGNFSTPQPEPGLNVLEARGPRPAERAQRDRIRARLLDGARAPRATRPRRQAPDHLERADDRRARRGRRGARERRAPTSTPPSRCAEFILARPARRATGGCCAPTTTARRASAPTSRTTPSCSRRCIVLFEATLRGALVRRGRALADTLIARFADPEHGGFFSTAADGEAADRAAQGPRGHADPVRALERGDRPAAPVRSSPARPSTSARPLGALRAASREIAPRHPTAFGHLLQALHWHFAPARPIACAVPDQRNYSMV